ncbi:MAG: ABC transporter substrate-binding protein [Solirubrobacterales bacterium]
MTETARQRSARKKSVLAALAIAGLALAIAACNDDEDTSHSGTGPGEVSLDLTVADLIPLSGELQDFGPPADKAAEIAVDQIDDAIDEVGADHQVTLKTEDDQTSTEAGIAVARKLVGDGATCITGSWSSAVTIAVARSVSIPDGILQISPASTRDELNSLDDDGLVNRTVPPDSAQGPVLADAIADDLGGARDKTVNIGARDDAYGNGIAGTFEDAWRSLGGKVGERVTYNPGAGAFDGPAEKITTGNPDATVIVDFPQTFAKLAPALERTGDYDPSTTWGPDALASSSLADDVGADLLDGIRGITPGVSDDDPPSKAFDELYTSTDPKDIDRQTFDAQNFDAVVLCYLAAVAAGSTDGREMADHVREISAPPGRQYTWEQLPDAIRTLQKGKDIDYQGASGPIDMNGTGDATAGSYDVYEYSRGRLTLVDELPLKPGE